MPNYTENRIEMKSIANLDVFNVVEHKNYKDETFTTKEFDFNKIIPRSEDLDLVSGSITTEAIVYYCSTKNTRESKKDLVDILAKKRSELLMIDLPIIQKKLEAKSREELDELYTLGEKYVSNFKKYGEVTWYEWSIKNWGTKWNAVYTDIVDDDFITFQTAWDAPHPVILELSRQNPGVEISHTWADEDIGSGTGYAKYLDGERIDLIIPEARSQEAFEFYVECWGDDEYLKKDDNGNYYVDFD